VQGGRDDAGSPADGTVPGRNLLGRE